MLTLEAIEAAETPYDRDPRADSDDPRAFQMYRGNRAMASVFKKGARAAVEGKKLNDQPYYDARTYRGGVTFSRAFMRAWCEGWHFATHDGDRSACTLQVLHDGPCKLRTRGAGGRSGRARRATGTAHA